MGEWGDEQPAESAPLVSSPIPYQGSKRRLAGWIVGCFPRDAAALYEPFCGSAAVALASAAAGRVGLVHLNDSNEALMALWEGIVERPDEVAAGYREVWEAQQGREREFYDRARAEFNRSQRPELLLYLLARCVAGAVRYNGLGQFNQSPDLRRRGTHPDRMAARIRAASALLRGRTTFAATDFRHALEGATPDDVAYLDPPYQGVSRGNRRYRAGLGVGDLVDGLAALNDRGVAYVLSYDGRTGAKAHGAPLPERLGLRRLELRVGRSTQATLLGQDSHTYESLYLSPALAERLARRQVSGAVRLPPATTA